MGGLMDGLSGDPYALRRMKEQSSGQAPYQNQFTQPTPEQEAMIQRESLGYTMSPMEFMTGAGVGAGMARGILGMGRKLAGIDKVPMWAKGLSYLQGSAAGVDKMQQQGQARYDRMMEDQPGAFPTYGYSHPRR